MSCLPDSVDSLSLPPIAATLLIHLNSSLIESIKAGYKDDPFCLKTSHAHKSIDGIEWKHGLLYIGNCLVIPHVGTLREDRFRLAHDTLGHFGFEKSYNSLRDSYYWPNMRTDLQQAYIPACVDCQQDKGHTTKPVSPLHPLPIPEQRGDSIGIDFIGPCPLDDGFDVIVTITDWLGADIHITPTHMDITAEKFAAQFFDLWYCKNGLPLDIVSDHDKIFVSKFWKSLTKLTGIKLKMSSSYHPESDGASKWSNKSVVQSLWFHIERNQSGWAKSLPLVRFDLMNTVNTSAGFSPFQIRMGRSPQLIPPLHPSTTPVTDMDEIAATSLIEQIALDISKAQDNLLRAKITHSEFANKHRLDEVVYAVGNKVMLSTKHRQ